MSKILIITPCATHPAVEGNARRILNLVEALLRLGHDAHLLYLPHFMFSLPDLEAMREHWKDRLHVASCPWSWIPGSLRRAILTRRERAVNRFGVLRGHKQGVAPYDRLVDSRWEREVLDVWRRYRFDVVIAEYIVISSLLRVIPDSVLKIIDTHDVFAERDRRVSHVPKRLRWFATTREEEALGLNRAHVVLAIQEREIDHFRELTRNPVVTVGHLLDRVAAVGEPGPPPSVLMVSSWNPINRHGLAVFLEQSWPLVRDAIPEARLRLVGNIGQVVAGEWPGLERLGVVGDSIRAYQQGHVVINPVLEGTGLPIKSIEALASGKPLVTTPSGARGIDDGEGAAFLVGPNPADFAAAVVRLLLDAKARQALAVGAVRYASAWNQRQLQSLQHAVELPAPVEAGVGENTLPVRRSEPG